MVTQLDAKKGFTLGNMLIFMYNLNHKITDYFLQYRLVCLFGAMYDIPILLNQYVYSYNLAAKARVALYMNRIQYTRIQKWIKIQRKTG